MPQLRVSLDTGSDDLAAELEKHGVQFVIEDKDSFMARSDVDDAYNVIRPRDALFDFKKGEWPLVGQFISLYFCCGHIKSAGPAAADGFVEAFMNSDK